MEPHGITQLRQRRTSHAIGTTTGDIAEVVTTTGMTMRAETAGVEVVFTLRTGAEVRLAAPTL